MYPLNRYEMLAVLRTLPSGITCSRLLSTSVISQDEFPDDLAISRRVDAANVPGAIVTIKGFFDRMVDRDHDGQVSEAEWNAFLVQLKTMFSEAARADSDPAGFGIKENRMD